MCENLVLVAMMAAIIGAVKLAITEAENPSVDPKEFAARWREFDLSR